MTSLNSYTNLVQKREDWTSSLAITADSEKTWDLTYVNQTSMKVSHAQRNQ